MTSQKLPSLLLLLGCMAIWGWHAEAREYPEAPGPQIAGDEFFFPSLNSPGGMPGSPFNPDIGECWYSIFRPIGCATSIFQSFLGGQFGLSRECCDAVKEMGEQCFQKAFPFDASFGLQLMRLCAKPLAPARK